MAQRALYQRIGFALGPIAAAAVWLSPGPADLSAEAWRVVGLVAWMATWWATEAIPVPATSIMPLALLPILGAASIGAAAAPYANPIIFLLLGGFIIALSLERWNLHRRIALMVLARAGERQFAIMGGFMAVAAFLSMWISNTATTMMMVPIALSVAAAMRGGKERAHDPFLIMLLLGIAYSASIGGMGTLIGTTTNAVAAGYMLEAFGRDLTFLDWMSFALPVVIVFVPLAWLVLRLLAKMEMIGAGDEARPGAARFIDDELRRMGRITVPEKRVALLCGAVALLWISRAPLQSLPGLSGLSDAGIAIAGALALFVIPAGDPKDKDAFLLDWEATTRMNWGVLLLFGGGLSLAAAIEGTGLAGWLGGQLSGLTTLPPILLIAAIVTLVVFLTELTSNTATAATLMPILGAVAVEGGYDPILLIAPAAMAASAAFMLPVATGPNAVVFGTGRIHVPEMARPGFWLNLVAILLLTTFGYFLVPLIAA